MQSSELLGNHVEGVAASSLNRVNTDYVNTEYMNAESGYLGDGVPTLLVLDEMRQVCLYYCYYYYCYCCYCYCCCYYYYYCRRCLCWM